MSVTAYILQASAILVVTWLLCEGYRRFVAPSPFDNIPGPAPQSFLKGHLGRLYHRHGWDFQRELGEQYGPVVRLDGLLGAKQLFVFDPVAMQSIIIKDQHVYEEGAFILTSNYLMFGGGLLAVLGDEHRKQRKMLNPVFHIKHMRHMLPIFYRITHKLREAICAQLSEGSEEIDVLYWMSRTALELVGQAGLGYSFDPLTHEMPNKYAEALKSFTPTLAPMFQFAAVLPAIFQLGTAQLRRRIVEIVPISVVQQARKIADAMHASSKEIYEQKKEAMAKGDEAVLQQIGEGKDIISVLMQANTAASDEDRLSDSDILAQMSTLVFAATDTTSGALSRILQLLAQHPDVQEKLRTELISARDGRDAISYDELSELPYLDAICRETLRLYPPVIHAWRTARKDMVLPLSAPITGRDGKPIHEIFVPNGTDIIVGIMASNRNPALWGEDSYEWKPERWLSPLPDAVTQAHIPGVYSNLMTFLGGGRSCIGFKFSQMEMKVVLSVLLETFSFSPSETPAYWNLAGIQYPTLGPTDTKEGMPLKVTLLINMKN